MNAAPFLPLSSALAHDPLALVQAAPALPPRAI